MPTIRIEYLLIVAILGIVGWEMILELIHP